MKRIYTKNNYLIIEWSGSAPLMRPKKNIFFYRADNDPNKYFITDNQKSVPAAIQTVLWSDFVKEDGTHFGSIVEFNDWITENTGNFSHGSDSGEFEPLNYDLADFSNTSTDPYIKQSQKPKDGAKGDKGDRGEQGLQGVAGKDGKDGKDGAKGEPGNKGETGFTGPIGPAGPAGPQGERGNDGSIGPRGLKGEDGATGLQGPKGDKGEKGDVGPVGPQGIQGLKGDKGDMGVPGPKGDQGVKGDSGAAGSSGLNSFSIPTLRTGIAKGVAYQALNPAKPAIITITLNAISNATLTIATNNAANILIGATNAVATGTGTVVGKYNNTLSVGVLISTGIANTYTINLPAGYFFAILNANNTTGVTIDSVVDQQVG